MRPGNRAVPPIPGSRRGRGGSKYPWSLGMKSGRAVFEHTSWGSRFCHQRSISVPEIVETDLPDLCCIRSPSSRCLDPNACPLERETPEAIGLHLASRMQLADSLCSLQGREHVGLRSTRRIFLFFVVVTSPKTTPRRTSRNWPRLTTSPH